MKPLGCKSYGSIPHLPGSRRGPGDIGLSHEQGTLLTEQCRRGDIVIVQEKLDGSNVGICRKDGQIVPMTREGWVAESSPHSQHHIFHKWVLKHQEKFNFLDEGERICGEWMLQAHGTRYDLTNRCPFVAFDIFNTSNKRVSFKSLVDTCNNNGITTAPTLSQGPRSVSIEEALSLLGNGYYGAEEEVEGCVWRLETKGEYNFHGKYVRHGKEDGKYFTTPLI